MASLLTIQSGRPDCRLLLEWSRSAGSGSVVCVKGPTEPIVREHSSKNMEFGKGCSLQDTQVGQAADSLWDDPTQPVLLQVSIIKVQAKLGRLMGSQNLESEWDSSLQVCQLGQLADSFWNGPAQLVLVQFSA